MLNKEIEQNQARNEELNFDNNIRMITIKDIKIGKRKRSEQDIKLLVESIKTSGLCNPIILRLPLKTTFFEKI